MKVWGKKCSNCKDIVWSRAGHDFRYCTCGDIFVDGGQSEYGSRVGYTKVFPESVDLVVYGVDKKSIYWDLKKGNKLGLIRGGTIDLRQQQVITNSEVRPN